MNGRILIVDDDEDLQGVIGRAAEKAGYEVLHALDGHEGLALAAAGNVDLILLDINMPAMDGRDVLSRLKRDPATSTIPVLVQSGRSAQLDRHVVLELGADDFVDKPMEPRLLMAKIGRLIARARANPRH
jgi:DNA-binding response OmpR family regulator